MDAPIEDPQGWLSWLAMTGLYLTVGMALFLWLFNYVNSKRPSRQPVTSGNKRTDVDGKVFLTFQRVREAFEENLDKGWEPSGAALAVYFRNELVVDLYGGYADLECRRPWKKDTLNVTFSSTKAVAALCVAVLVEKKYLDYDALVTDYWPEFGRNGKERCTVQWLLSHMAGLPYFSRPMTFDQAQNSDYVAELIQNEEPKWPVGEKIGYHAITYGFLVDQLVRHVDPRNRGIAQFFQDEVRAKIGPKIDYHIGLPPSEALRVSRLRLPSLRQRLSEFWHSPGAVYYFRYFIDFMTDGALKRVTANFPYLQFIFEMSFNNPDLWPFGQCAVLGIGTARGLAQLFEYGVLQKKLLKDATIKKFTTPYKRTVDYVTGAFVTRGNGLMFTDFELDGETHQMIGHAGVGGQNIKFDLSHDLCFAYVSNGLKAGFGDSARTFVTLRDAIYRCVLDIEAAEREARLAQ